MAVREVLNRNPMVTGGVAAGVIGLILIIWLVRALGSGSEGISEAWYSNDDGQTYFGGGLNEIPPFTKDGKDAVKAYVFKCKGTKPFVGYLERYTVEAKKRLDKLQALNPEEEVGPTGLGRVGFEGVEVKKPGDQQWVSMAEEMHGTKKVTVVTCPDGKTEGLEAVVP